MPLDTLRIAKQMEAAGMPRPQSEALANVLKDEYFDQLVTNSDLGVAVDRLETKIEAVEQRLEAKIGAVEQRLEAKIEAVEQRLEAKIAALDSKIDTVASRLGSRIDSLEARMQMMQWMVGLNLAISLGILWKILR